MSERFAVLGTCGTCSGEGRVPNPGYPGTLGCGRCNGHGVRRKRDYGYCAGYKTAATAARAVADGRGETCSYCEGSGRVPYPQWNDCYACHGGTVVTECHPGDVLPDGVDIYAHIPTGVARVLADELAVAVHPQDREGTWNEAFLGLGAVVSVTDYGRRWDAWRADEVAGTAALVADVRESLARGGQWLKLADKGTRRVALTVHVLLHRNGYTVVSDASVSVRPMLPPTYTAEALNRPVR